MASDVGICNAALQKLGADRIASLAENSRNARSCAAAYERLRQAELRAHPWSFAISREQLAADATAPAFGRARAFPLPSDFLRLLAPYPEQNLNSLDWVIESHAGAKCVMTNDSAPLNVRYIQDVTDANRMDPLFREVLATAMALDMCEEITQSNTKKAGLKADYKDLIREARRVNAIEKTSEQPPDDEWLTVRQ